MVRRGKRNARDLPAVPLILVFAITLFIIVLPILAVWGLVYLVRGVMLRRYYVAKWGHQGRLILLVYSESSNWQHYIEEHWLPKLEDVAVVLNWSRRAEWRPKPPLEARVMRHWGGDREFNPLAVCFVPWRPVDVIRFFTPFKEFKHGKEGRLREAEARLFRLAEQIRRPRT